MKKNEDVRNQNVTVSVDFFYDQIFLLFEAAKTLRNRDQALRSSEWIFGILLTARAIFDDDVYCCLRHYYDELHEEFLKECSQIWR